jgi:hypothetical protein
MKRLWVKLFGEGDDLICSDRDSAKEVHVAVNTILEVPIGDRTQKRHYGNHCVNARLSRAKPIGPGRTILGAGAQTRLGMVAVWNDHLLRAVHHGSTPTSVITMHHKKKASIVSRNARNAIIAAPHAPRRVVFSQAVGQHA